MHKYIQDLLSFLDASPTSVQASYQISQRLDQLGFTELLETDPWNLTPGGKYYIRRETSVIAFVCGTSEPAASGFHLAAAHIDSPALKIKPESLKTDNGITRVAVEVYGGPIISTWLDRELGIAGRVSVVRDGIAQSMPVDLGKAVAIIPNAAIHLNREVNNGFVYNKQTHLQAILQTTKASGNPLVEAVAAQLGIETQQIAEMELFLYDFAKAALGGMDSSLIISGRLDNLAMSHAILSAICATEDPHGTSVAVLYDHEEVGSETLQGAGSSMLSEVLERIALARGLNREQYFRALRASFLISADMAHAYHPSYPEKYEPSTAPAMNGGPVVKWNASSKYASTAASSQLFSALCLEADVRQQKFVMRSDLLCGSTVGPIVSAQLGIPAVDVGNPLWAMHSIRETAGVQDHLAMIAVLTKYFLR